MVLEVTDGALEIAANFTSRIENVRIHFDIALCLCSALSSSSDMSKLGHKRAVGSFLELHYENVREVHVKDVVRVERHGDDVSGIVCV